MTHEPVNASVTIQNNGGETLVTLLGEWSTRTHAAAAAERGTWFDRADLSAIRFDTRQLGHWDSVLLVYLSNLQRAAVRRSIRFDDRGIPAAARRLLALVPHPTGAPSRSSHRPAFVERVGLAAQSSGTEVAAVTALVGDQIIRTTAAALGRARMRRVDLIASLYDAGIAALPMVALVNVMVGGILAFVGAIELRRFGADIYVANLVGIAQVREMAAVMTAIVMSGRTGGAYAAELASMRGSNELDALGVLGIPVQDYLVLPRMLGLTLMMPLLYLYGSVLGILGGFIVAVTMLDISPGLFIAQTRDAVAMNQVVFGLTKSIVFGAFISIAGCRIGLKAGRSATDVGNAATRAVVVGIIGVIMLDALFAVCANALDI